MYKKFILYVFTILFVAMTYSSSIANEIIPARPIETTNVSAQDNVASQSVERRKFIRFRNLDIKTKLELYITDNNSTYDLIDISRGGLAIHHNSKFKKGDIIPVHIVYKDLEFDASVQITSADDNRAGGTFIVQDKDTMNKLLYLSIVLEFDNGLLVTRFKQV